MPKIFLELMQNIVFQKVIILLKNCIELLIMIKKWMLIQLELFYMN
jgi:hypothetical protein